MIVLDASVVLKWLLPEEEHGGALRFLDQHRKGVEPIIVPSLLHYEVGNVLRYHKAVPDAELVELFDILGDIGLTLMHPSVSELEEAVLYAREKNTSVYDAVYVVLARRLGCRFITADKKLADQVQESFIQVLS